MKLQVNEIKYASEDIIITSDVAIDFSNLNSSNFTLTYLDTDAVVNIPILTSAITSGDDKTIILKTPILESNKIYYLSVFSIPSVTLINEIVVADSFKFLSIENLYNKTLNPNNVYTKLQGLNKILSVENLLKKEEDYLLKFTPTKFDEITKTTVNGTEEVSIPTNKTIIDKLIGSFYSEYKDFYQIVNNREKEKIDFAAQFDDNYINNIHLSFMKNMPKWNSLKGNRRYIEIMLQYYAQILGYNVLSVVEDLAANFVYRVSTSIPKLLWDKKIKPFVHPLSWKCIYNEITSFITGKNYQRSTVKQQMNRYDFDSEYKLLGIRNNNIRSYQYNNISVGDMTSEVINKTLAGVNDLVFEFSNPVSASLLTQDFNRADLWKISSANVAGNQKEYTIEYLMPGIAGIYQWDFYVNDVLVQQHNTRISKTKFVSSDSSSGFKFGLSLKTTNETTLIDLTPVSITSGLGSYLYAIVNSNVINRYVAGSGTLDPSFITIDVKNPMKIIFNDNSLYVFDDYNGEYVTKYDALTGVKDVSFSMNIGNDQLTSICIVGEYLYACIFVLGSVKRFSLSTGLEDTSFVYNVNGGYVLSVNNDGQNMYVSTTSNVIEKFNLTTMIKDESFVCATDPWPLYIFILDNFIYSASSTYTTVERHDKTSGVKDESFNCYTGYPNIVSIDHYNGELYVERNNIDSTSSITKFNINTGELITDSFSCEIPEISADIAFSKVPAVIQYDVTFA
jgi:hypothetical protein